MYRNFKSYISKRQIFKYVHIEYIENILYEFNSNVFVNTKYVRKNI